MLDELPAPKAAEASRNKLGRAHLLSHSNSEFHIANMAANVYCTVSEHQIDKNEGYGNSRLVQMVELRALVARMGAGSKTCSHCDWMMPDTR